MARTGFADPKARSVWNGMAPSTIPQPLLDAAVAALNEAQNDFSATVTEAMDALAVAGATVEAAAAKVRSLLLTASPEEISQATGLDDEDAEALKVKAVSVLKRDSRRSDLLAERIRQDRLRSEAFDEARRAERATR